MYYNSTGEPKNEPTHFSLSAGSGCNVFISTRIMMNSSVLNLTIEISTQASEQYIGTYPYFQETKI